MLTVYVETAIRTGVLDLTEEKPPISFTMLMEDTWKQELAEVGIL